jgi:hypothetical protein
VGRDLTRSSGIGEKFAQDVQNDPLQGPADDINAAADAAIKQFAFINWNASGGGRQSPRAKTAASIAKSASGSQSIGKILAAQD